MAVKVPIMSIVEKSEISPPSSNGFTSSLPLTFLDIPWLLHPPSQPLFFYNFSPSPSTTQSFTSTILPKLKHSLSLALLHFSPFAGKLALSNTSPLPNLLYSHTDSVHLTVAEASNYGEAEYNHLCSNNNNLKDAHVLHHLVPTCLHVTSNLLSVQITCFPHAGGFSIGLAYRHVVSDQRTFHHFLKAWASLCKLGDDALGCELRPCYDRAVIMGRDGLEPILTAQWMELKGRSHWVGVGPRPSGMVRGTFVMSPTDIVNGRNWIVYQCKKRNKPKPVLLSAYVVACALIWASMGKAQYGPAQKHGPVYFGFIAGGLTRLPYRVPANYFGNCVAFGRAEVGRGEEVVGEGGVEEAARAIAETVKRLDGDVVGGAERWIGEWEEMRVEGSVKVVGSPKVDVYGRDFGWGRPRKVEEVGIEVVRGVSLCESRDFKGGIEIGVVLTKTKMEAFSGFFYKGIKEFSMAASVDIAQ